MLKAIPSFFPYRYSDTTYFVGWASLRARAVDMVEAVGILI